MILILFGLLLFANVLSAQAESPTLTAVPYARTNGFIISRLMADGSGMPFKGTSIRQPTVDPWRKRSEAAPPRFASDH